MDMKSKSILFVGFILLLSGCVGSFSPAVFPDKQQVTINSALTEEQVTALNALFPDATSITAHYSINDDQGTSGTLRKNGSDTAFRSQAQFPEGLWNVSVILEVAGEEAFVGETRNVRVTVGQQQEEINVPLQHNTRDVEFTVDLGSVDRANDAFVTLSNTPSKLPNHQGKVHFASLGANVGTATVNEVPVGTWDILLSVEQPNGGITEFAGLSNALQVSSRHNVAPELRTSLIAGTGTLDVIVDKWEIYPPSAPTNLAFQQTADNTVLLSWDPVTGSDIRYAVWRKRAPVENRSFEMELLSPNVTQTSYSDVGEHIRIGSREELTFTYWVQAHYEATGRQYVSHLSRPRLVQLRPFKESEEDLLKKFNEDPENAKREWFTGIGIVNFNEDYLDDYQDHLAWYANYYQGLTKARIQWTVDLLNQLWQIRNDWNLESYGSADSIRRGVGYANSLHELLASETLPNDPANRKFREYLTGKWNTLAEELLIGEVQRVFDQDEEIPIHRDDRQANIALRFLNGSSEDSGDPGVNVTSLIDLESPYRETSFGIASVEIIDQDPAADFVVVGWDPSTREGQGVLTIGLANQTIDPQMADIYYVTVRFTQYSGNFVEVDLTLNTTLLRL